MHHVVLEGWSHGTSLFHRRDPRAKIIVLLIFLIVVATAHHQLPILASALMLVLCGTVVSAGLPLAKVLVRAGVVLIFTLALALSSWIAGDPERALALVLKSYLSALAVLLVVATTPMPDLLQGLESTRVPRFLLMVAQFLYRYLFVISDEAQHMRKAAAARGGGHFIASAGALAGLFARSYSRAEDIRHAMLARGFPGHFHTLQKLHFRRSDTAFTVLASVLPVLLRVTVEKVT